MGEYKCINMSYLREMSSGDKDFVIDMVSDWLIKSPNYILDLTSAIDSENKDEIRFFQHKLHSSFQIIGALDLAKICAKIEDLALNDADLALILDNASKINPIYKDVVIELNQELKQLNNKLTND